MSGEPTTPIAGAGVPPTPPESAAANEAGPADLIAAHPEVIAGAAFVGGLVTAMIARRLGR